MCIYIYIYMHICMYTHVGLSRSLTLSLSLSFCLSVSPSLTLSLSVSCFLSLFAFSVPHSLSLALIAFPCAFLASRLTLVMRPAQAQPDTRASAERGAPDASLLCPPAASSDPGRLIDTPGPGRISPTKDDGLPRTGFRQQTLCKDHERPGSLGSVRVFQYSSWLDARMGKCLAKDDTCWHVC